MEYRVTLLRQVLCDLLLHHTSHKITGSPDHKELIAALCITPLRIAAVCITAMCTAALSITALCITALWFPYDMKHTSRLAQSKSPWLNPPP